MLCASIDNPVSLLIPAAVLPLLLQVNADGKVIQELQVSPMGVIELIYPLNDQTDNGLGLDIFAQVGALAAAAAAAAPAAGILHR
jgi:CHASE1-domain containing sensor protein